MWTAYDPSTREGDAGHREQVEALGAEAVGGPPGERDHAGERQGVAGHRPGDLGRGRVELLLEGVEGDRDDGDVEDRHDGAEDDHTGHHQDALVELVGVVGLRLAGLELGVGHPTTILVASDNDPILFAVVCVTLRVMREVEDVARRLQAGRGPSLARIEDLDGVHPPG